MKGCNSYSSRTQLKQAFPFFSTSLVACSGLSNIKQTNLSDIVVTGKAIKGPLASATVFTDYDYDDDGLFLGVFPSVLLVTFYIILIN